MAERLKGKRVAILATSGLEPEVVSPTPGQVRGCKHTGWGSPKPAEVEPARADWTRYHAPVPPGGVMNPAEQRASRGTLDFVRAFVTRGRSSRPFATDRGPS